jgi:hypothetical protein
MHKETESRRKKGRKELKSGESKSRASLLTRESCKRTKPPTEDACQTAFSSQNEEVARLTEKCHASLRTKMENADQ